MKLTAKSETSLRTKIFTNLVGFLYMFPPKLGKRIKVTAEIAQVANVPF